MPRHSRSLTVPAALAALATLAALVALAIALTSLTAGAQQAPSLAAESTTVATPARHGPFVRSGLHAGVAAGTTLPSTHLQTAYRTGWNLTVPVAWDTPGLPLGFRVDGAYDRLVGGTPCASRLNDAAIVSLVGDATLRWRVPGQGPLTALYALGGGGAHRIVAASGGEGGLDAANGFATSLGGAPTLLGWNAGVGLTFAVGRSTLFLESRYVSIDTRNTRVETGRLIPIVLGVEY